MTALQHLVSIGAPSAPTDAPARDVTPARPSRAVLRTVVVVVAIVAIALLASAALFRLNGGSWFIVETPSMGTAAPVGTFVLTGPTTRAELHVGDVIAFHPPTTPNETYTHRITAISDAGLISTQGDINGAADPWQLTEQNVVGKATAIIPGLGWLIRGLPIVLLGLVVVWLVTSRVKVAPRKVAYRITGLSLVFSVAAFILKPFTGVVVEQIDVTDGTAKATVVGTGLLPIRVQADHGTYVDLVSGQIGHVTVPATANQDLYSISTALHLDFWGWVIFATTCCLPLLWTLIVGLPPRTEEAS